MHRTQWFILLAVLTTYAISARIHYLQPHHHGLQQLNNSLHSSVTTKEKYTLIDSQTGIQYNPHNKHYPGKHVCTNHRNVSRPLKTKQAYCKPIYKKYVVTCGDKQICNGIRLVYETHYKDIITTVSSNEVLHVCCPGWTQISNRSHGCNKPICSKPCLNQGRCVKPDVCYCPKGFVGSQCEIDLNRPICSNGCRNGGSCIRNEICKCPSGFRGYYCELDVDECKEHKPCDHICQNTMGSFICECKENFLLQNDKQSCRKENFDDTTFEAKDLEFEFLDKRLLKLETMMGESHKNDVRKSDIDIIYKDMDHINKDIIALRSKLGDMENYKHDMYVFKSKLNHIEKKAEKVDVLLQNYDNLKQWTIQNQI